jgi:hypothetical protein
MSKNKKLLIVSVSFLFFFCLSASAQKEVYFSDKSRDSVSISAIQGVQIGATLSSDYEGLNVPVSIGYFNELKLGYTTSLILSGNISMVKALSSFSTTYITNDYGSYYVSNIVYEPAIELAIKAEPRWYFSYQNRYVKGNNIKINSGFFLSLPCEISTNPLTKFYPFQLNLSTAASFGFRYAITNNFFIEPAANLGIGLYNFRYFSTITPYLSLKAAYTFK